jgi:predicted nucleotidyltransferase
MDSELVQQLASAARELFQAQNIVAAYAYGSRISGRPRPDSDLDVGYYLTGYRRGAGLTLQEESLLASRLTDALGVNVDLRNLAEAPLELRGRVLEDGVRVFSGDDIERVGLERDLLARYHDYKDVFQAMHELRLKRMAERGR